MATAGTALSLQDVERIILDALHRLNDELPEDRKIEPSPDLPLLGVDAVIDSLSIISLIVDIEGVLTADYGLDIALADDRAVSRPISPFLTASTLRDYIMTLLNEQAA